MLGTGRNTAVTPTAGGQKFVILQSRSQTPTGSGISNNTIQPPQTQILPTSTNPQPQQQIKVAQAAAVQQPKPHIAQQQTTAITKRVVVCVANNTHTNTTIVSQVNRLNSFNYRWKIFIQPFLRFTFACEIHLVRIYLKSIFLCHKNDF